MSFVIGVDGGGTKMRVALLDLSGQEIARAEHPGGVVTHEAPGVAVTALQAAVWDAVDQAGVELPASALWAGLAGAGQEAARSAVLAALATAKLAEIVHVGTDAEPAFHDAFGVGPGMLLIGGTGSIAWGRDGRGRIERVGGWGRLLGDEGSGHDIGVQALRAVARAHDGRIEPTALTSSVLAHCGQQEVTGLVRWAEKASKADVAQLAPLVVSAAEAGDATAEAIVEASVTALVAHVEALARRLGEEGAPELLLWGGLLADGGPLGARVSDALRSAGVPVLDRSVDPPAGAAKLALGLL